jgi:hypothetical protein
MRKGQSTLTNEVLKGLFKNNFDLANHAIRLARHYVKSGHEISIDSILQEIRRNPHESYIDDLQNLDDNDE